MADNDFLQWRTDYSVGVLEIDEQHKEIMVLINKLLKICRGDEGDYGRTESINQLMLIIKEQFQKHFETEERMMRETQYPKYKPHKLRHDKLLEDIEQVMTRIVNIEQKTALINMVIFLREWFVENIYGVDKQMGEHFVRCGICS